MVNTTAAVSALKVNGINMIRLDGVELFDVRKVFDCGQCFRFDEVLDSRHDIEFAGVVFGKYISVAQDGDTVYIYNATVEEYESVWKKFLGLNRDYGEINANILALSDNPALYGAVSRSSGIRILYQDAWEAICSFIISQNNNIPRIKKLVAAISLECGEPVDLSGMDEHIADVHKAHEGNFYSFPSPESLIELGVAGLAAIKTGFRAKYIYDAASRVSSGEIDLDLIEKMNTADAVKYLCSVKGIGPKVASCALLFGFAKLDAFPIDVWIKKVIAKYFDADFDPDSLGQYAGIAQQYLFYYERYLQSQEG
ncbi:MAG: DNA-3-methyladenine glycosylase 2 family protein [Ruminococcaceae bacterium]|nr:DNA-3-methyladenine glycosylase 2 family protein [Oscillospiraceae bacterium]